MREISHPNILQDLIEFAENTSLKYKVTRVFRMCMQHHHFTWAHEIQQKYAQYFETKSDILMAFAFSMMADKNRI